MGGNPPAQQAERRGATRVVGTVSMAGVEGDEAAGQPLGKGWDGATIHRGAKGLLTMTGQLIGAAASCQAARGPWLGPFIYICT